MPQNFRNNKFQKVNTNAQDIQFAKKNESRRENHIEQIRPVSQVESPFEQLVSSMERNNYQVEALNWKIAQLHCLQKQTFRLNILILFCIIGFFIFIYNRFDNSSFNY